MAIPILVSMAASASASLADPPEFAQPGAGDLGHWLICCAACLSIVYLAIQIFRSLFPPRVPSVTTEIDSRLSSCRQQQEQMIRLQFNPINEGLTRISTEIAGLRETIEVNNSKVHDRITDHLENFHLRSPRT